MTDNEVIKALEKAVNKANEIIHRQKAEIERLKDVILQNNKDTFSACAMMIEEERERVRIEYTRRLEEEIERLNKANERFAKEFDSYYAFVKSEAIKEFAERLKAEKFIHKNFGELVQVEDIDTIAKELSVNYESSKNDTQRKEDEKNA